MSNFALPPEFVGTASDGTKLQWQPMIPRGPGPWPFVLVVHGGGFRAGNRSTVHIPGPDLNDAGFAAFGVDYRLAPPGKMYGQKSDGRYPQQQDDVKMAIDKAKADPRCDGNVFMVGGSAGGYQTAWWAAKGNIKAGVSLSGPTSFEDPESLRNRKFASLVKNYAPTDPHNASPVTYVNPSMSPLFLINSEDETIPLNQLTLEMDAMDANGVEHGVLILPGSQHAFDYWSDVAEQAIGFLKAYL